MTTASIYKRQYRGLSSPKMPAAEQSSPSAPRMHSHTGSQSPSVTEKASFAIDVINLARGPEFRFQEYFDNCANLQKQLQAFQGGRTKNGEDWVDLALRYANAQTHMIEEFYSLRSSCQIHANSYQQENYNIHGDVKDFTICMNECFDLVKASFGSKIQHQGDLDRLQEIPDSQTSETDMRIQSLIAEAQKKSNLDNDFIDKLRNDGRDFVLKSMNQETPSSEQPKFLFDPLINLFEKGNDFFRNSMNQQTPSFEHSNFLFKNILNLYEIEYALFLVRHTLELVENPSVCLSQELEQQINANTQKPDFSKMLQENTLSKKNSKRSIESHQALNSGDSTINQKLTRLIVQAMAFTTMFLTIDTASKSSDENIKQFKINLTKVLKDYIRTMQNVQKEKNVYYANNK